MDGNLEQVQNPDLTQEIADSVSFNLKVIMIVNWKSIYSLFILKRMTSYVKSIYSYLK